MKRVQGAENISVTVFAWSKFTHLEKEKNISSFAPTSCPEPINVHSFYTLYETVMNTSRNHSFSIYASPSLFARYFLFTEFSPIRKSLAIKFVFLSSRISNLVDKLLFDGAVLNLFLLLLYPTTVKSNRVPLCRRYLTIELFVYELRGTCSMYRSFIVSIHSLSLSRTRK